jgi:hypothetical protein
MLDTIRELVIRLNHALGYDFNTVEFAVMDGIPYAIDFCNPSPDADVHSVGQVNFEWIVENAAEMAIEKAKSHRPGGMNLTWGTFVSNAVAGQQLSPENVNKSPKVSESKSPKVSEPKSPGVQKAKSPKDKPAGGKK